jgi:hypothetical protein
MQYTLTFILELLNLPEITTDNTIMVEENTSGSKTDFCGQAEKDFSINSPRKKKQKIIHAQNKKDETVAVHHQEVKIEQEKTCRCIGESTGKTAQKPG